MTCTTDFNCCIEFGAWLDLHYLILSISIGLSDLSKNSPKTISSFASAFLTFGLETRLGYQNFFKKLGDLPSSRPEFLIFLGVQGFGHECMSFQGEAQSNLQALRSKRSSSVLLGFTLVFEFWDDTWFSFRGWDLLRFREMRECQFEGKQKVTSKLWELGLAVGTSGMSASLRELVIVKRQALKTRARGGMNSFEGRALGLSIGVLSTSGGRFSPRSKCFDSDDLVSFRVESYCSNKRSALALASSCLSFFSWILKETLIPAKQFGKSSSNSIVLSCKLLQKLV